VRESRNLQIWHKARALVNEIYTSTRGFPADELYGLRAQLRRATVSVMANIAEGAGRGTDPEFARFLRIALGSAAEVETLLVIAADQGMLPADAALRLNEQIDEIRRMGTRLDQVLRASR
jgi:four helix bundle protein